nr:hypothetical protein GCM10020063_067180 [Dactylosporangium thailandense]
MTAIAPPVAATAAIETMASFRLILVLLLDGEVGWCSGAINLRGSAPGRQQLFGTTAFHLREAPLTA